MLIKLNTIISNNFIAILDLILTLPQLVFFFFGHLVSFNYILLYKVVLPTKTYNINEKKYLFNLINIYIIYIFNFLKIKTLNFLLEKEYLYIENYNILFTNNINMLTLLLAIIIAFGFVMFLLLQAKLLNISFYPNATFDAEKYSPYECGFAPFRTERAQFDIKFYLVALLFLVFDVELMFLLPYCVSYYYLGTLGYVIFIIFFSILIIGFLVEWAVGMLNWKGEENTTLNKLKVETYNSDFIYKTVNYIYYLNNEYLNYLDKYGFSVEFKKNMQSTIFVFLRRLKRWRPYYKKYSISYQEKEPEFRGKETYKQQINLLDLRDPLYFHTDKKLFYGGSTYSIVAYYMYIEDRQKQEKIERFFTNVYGDLFTNWLKTATKERRDFTLTYYLPMSYVNIY